MTRAWVEEGQPRPGQPALTDARFLGYILARGFTLIGDNIWWVAVGWAAAQLGNPGLTGVVLAVTGIPRVALMLVGGAVTDIHGSRPIMLVSDFLAGIAAIVAAVLALTQEKTAAALLIVMGLIFGTIDSFYLPASSTYLASLLPKQDLPRGVAVRQLTTGIATAAGRSLGGVLVALGGFALAAFVNGASFFICFAIFYFVRPKYPVEPAKERTIGKALFEGLRYVMHTPTIRVLAFLSVVLNLVTSPVLVVGLALRGTEAGWGPQGYGLVAGCIGAGMIAGGLLGTILEPPRRAGLALSWWAAAICVPFAVLALTDSMLWACVAAVGWTLCLGPQNAILAGLLLATTESSLLGRVQSFVVLLSGALSPVGIALYGIAVAIFGLDAVGIVCVLCLALTVVVMFLAPEIRGARLPDD